MVVIFSSNHFRKKSTHTHFQPPLSGYFTVSYFSSVDTFYIRKDQSACNEKQNDLNVLAQVVAYKGLDTMENIKTVSPKSGHSCLGEVLIYKRFQL